MLREPKWDEEIVAFNKGDAILVAWPRPIGREVPDSSWKISIPQDPRSGKFAVAKGDGSPVWIEPVGCLISDEGHRVQCYAMSEALDHPFYILGYAVKSIQ